MIRHKKQMKRMLAEGRFGNAMIQWATLREMQDSGYRGNVYVRTNVAMDGLKAFEVPAEKVPQLGVDFSTCHFYEAPPNDWRVIQGDVQRSASGLYLFYSTMKAPLRTAQTEEPQHAYGLTAEMLLREKLTPQSYDHLLGLTDKYDGVVEFTEFCRPIGTDQRNLIVWEVRSY